MRESNIYVEVGKELLMLSVTSDGKIYSEDRLDSMGRTVLGKEKRPSDNGKGYKSICLTTTTCGIRYQKRFYVHRLMAMAFLEYDDDLEVNHKDGDKANNKIINLEMCTRKENSIHSLSTLVGPDYSYEIFEKYGISCLINMEYPTHISIRMGLPRGVRKSFTESYKYSEFRDRFMIDHKIPYKIPKGRCIAVGGKTLPLRYWEKYLGMSSRSLANLTKEERIKIITKGLEEKK